MNCHFRSYCFHLAEKLNMTVHQLQTTLDSGEISEWMAYELTQSDVWIEKYNKEKELELSKQMSQEERTEAFKRLFKKRTRDE